MKIYDLPDTMSHHDKFDPWIKAHEIEITTALKNGYNHFCDWRVDHVAKETSNKAGVVVLLLAIILGAFFNLVVGALVGVVLYFCVYWIAKSATKKSAFTFYDHFEKDRVLRKCLEEILNKELAEAETEAQEKEVQAFFNYAICFLHHIDFKYTK